MVTRLGLYSCVFLILNMAVTSDVSGFYYPEGRHALQGEIVYRDFLSNYSPGFPYLIALILTFWNSAKAIVLATICVEGLSLLIWLRVTRKIWSEEDYRMIALLYVLSATSILDVAIAGQNQVWIALFLGVAVLLYQQRRTLATALVVGLPIVLVKLLPLLYVPAFLRRRSRPVQVACMSLAFPVSVACVLLANRIDITQPIRLQAPLITFGNLPYLASSVVSLDGRAAIIFQAISVLVVAAVSVYFMTRSANLNTREIVLSLVILTLTCALSNKKFFSSYLMMAFVPLCSVAALERSRVRSVVTFGLFNAAACLEPSLWFRLLHATERHSNLWQLVGPLRQSQELWKLSAFLGVEVLLLAGYVYYLARAWTLLRSAAPKGFGATGGLARESHRIVALHTNAG